jgi:hypothetical protein
MLKAGQEVCANAMSRKQGARREAESGNTDEEGDGAEQLTNSLDSEDMITPANSWSGRKWKKHSTLELEDLLAATQENCSQQEQMRLKMEMNVWALLSVSDSWDFVK